MKFLLDANIPYSAKESFPKQHEIFHVRDLHLQHSSDEEIIVWAQKHKSALITRDFDFANILNLPPAKYSGIIVLKIPYFYTASDIKKILGNFIRAIDETSITAATIIVEETRFRIKRQE